MEVSKHIAEVLGESDPIPVSQIAAVVEALGEVEALGILAQTERVESTGGMMVPDGSRKRTRGGIFFALARATLTPAQRRKIFTHAAATGLVPYAAATSDAAIRAAGATQVLVQLPRRESKPASTPPAPVAPVAPVPAATSPERVFEQIEQLVSSVDPAARAQLERRIGERFAPRRTERAAVSTDVLVGLQPRLREWLLAAVAAQLGASEAEAATSVFGVDSPSNRGRVAELLGLTMEDLLAAAADEKSREGRAR